LGRRPDCIALPAELLETRDTTRVPSPIVPVDAGSGAEARRSICKAEGQVWQRRQAKTLLLWLLLQWCL